MDNADFPDLEARFRSRFIAMRKRAGLKQEDVATYLEIAQQTVARFELGQRGLSANDMPKWAAAIGASWRSMLEDGAEASVRDLDLSRDEIAKGMEDARARAEAATKRIDELVETRGRLQAELDAAFVALNRAELERGYFLNRFFDLSFLLAHKSAEEGD